MKKIITYLMASLAAFAALTSCSEKETQPDGIESSIIENINGEYTASNTEKQLILTYNGTPMLGKVATVQSLDGQTAHLYLKGQNLLESKDMDLMSLIPCPGVIPGEKETDLHVVLTYTEGNSFTFEGKKLNTTEDINFKGSVDGKILNINLEVTAKNELAGTKWNLEPFDGDNYKTLPIHVNFESSKDLIISIVPGFPMYDIPLKLNDILGLATRSGMFAVEGETDKQNCHQMILRVLKAVDFTDNGNLLATYSEKENIANPKWVESAKGISMYYMAGSKVNVEMNIPAILQMITAPKTSAAEETAPEFKLDSLIAGALPLLPAIKDGVPFETRKTADNKMTIMLDPALTLSFVKDALVPFMKDETNHQIIEEKAAAIIASIMPTLDAKKIVNDLIDVLENTTLAEVGLNLEKDAPKAE